MDNLQYAKAEIRSRANSIKGTYSKGDFGLSEVDMNNFNGSAKRLTQRADLVDKLIRQYQREGKNTDDAEILEEIAQAVKAKAAPEKTFIGGLVTIVILVSAVFFLSFFISTTQPTTSNSQTNPSNLNTSKLDLENGTLYSNPKFTEIELNEQNYQSDNLIMEGLKFNDLGQELNNDFGFTSQYPKQTSGRLIHGSFMITNTSSKNSDLKISKIDLKDSYNRVFSSDLFFECNRTLESASGSGKYNLLLSSFEKTFTLTAHIPCRVDVLFEVAPEVRSGTLLIRYE